MNLIKKFSCKKSYNFISFCWQTYFDIPPSTQKSIKKHIKIKSSKTSYQLQKLINCAGLIEKIDIKLKYSKTKKLKTQTFDQKQP